MGMSLNDAYEREILGKDPKSDFPDDSDWDYVDSSQAIRSDNFSFVDPVTKEIKHLDDAQVAIVREIEALLDDDGTPRGTLRVLSAAGGHGKSALESVLIGRNKHAVIATATTNKACAVLKSYGQTMETCHRVFMCPIKVQEGMDEHTIFLNLQEMQALCEKKNLRLPTSYHYKKERLGNSPAFLIVDEASQMNTQLWNAILASNFKVILLVGDSNQCPPINDYEHPLGVFNTLPINYTLERNYRLEGFLSSANEAQKQHYSLVSTTLKALREPDFAKKFDLVTSRDWMRFFEPLLPKSGQTLSELFNQGYQFICYTNQTRRMVNYLARLTFLQTEYGHTGGDCLDMELQLGETIMLKSNSKEDGRLFNGKLFDVVGSDMPGDRMRVLYQMGDEEPAKMLVNAKYLNWDMSGYTKKRGTNEVPNTLPADWLMRVRAESFTSNGDASDNNSASNEAIQNMLALASDINIISEPARDEEDVLKIVLGYCITIHNSQGSEFPKVCAIIPQRLMSKDDAGRRLLYTALSRTKGQLIVIPETWTGFSGFLK